MRKPPPFQTATQQVAAPHAAAVEVPIMHMSDAERAQMAKELGYIQIGKEVPTTVSLTDIVKSMPEE